MITLRKSTLPTSPLNSSKTIHLLSSIFITNQAFTPHSNPITAQPSLYISTPTPPHFTVSTETMRNTSENQPSFAKNSHGLKSIDLLLRFSVIPLTAVSIWLTVTNKQDSSVYGMLEFKNLIGLKYMVCINTISAGYSIVAIVTSWLRCLLTKAWVFFVSDQVVVYLTVTSVAAVVEILYLGYNGDTQVSWSEACSTYGSFCSRVKVALVLHGIALCCFIFLSLISAYRVFSKFEPPLLSKDLNEDGN